MVPDSNKFNCLYFLPVLLSRSIGDRKSVQPVKIAPFKYFNLLGDPVQPAELRAVE